MAHLPKCVPVYRESKRNLGPVASLQIENDRDIVDITCSHPVDLPGGHIHTEPCARLGNVAISLAACEQLGLLMWKKGRMDFLPHKLIFCIKI